MLKTQYILKSPKLGVMIHEYTDKHTEYIILCFKTERKINENEKYQHLTRQRL